MKAGDLVKVKDCPPQVFAQDFPCECFFCHHSSNRVGVVLRAEPYKSWAVMFDCGEWRLDEFDQARGDVKVISD
jgi:hypothetical protein